MKCPHCNYEYGYSVEENSNIEGEHGEFYKIGNNVKMVKQHDYLGNKTLNLYGCPSCMKVFMDY